MNPSRAQALLGHAGREAPLPSRAQAELGHEGEGQGGCLFDPVARRRAVFARESSLATFSTDPRSALEECAMLVPVSGFAAYVVYAIGKVPRRTTGKTEITGPSV